VIKNGGLSTSVVQIWFIFVPLRVHLVVVFWPDYDLLNDKISAWPIVGRDWVCYGVILAHNSICCW